MEFKQTPAYITEHYNGLNPREQRSQSYHGVKFFAGNPLPTAAEMQEAVANISADQLREQMKVWRPEETLEAAAPFFRIGRVNVIGDPQSGKGTILFGLSEICDSLGWGYLFIDGHHQEAPAEHVIEAIHKADSEGLPIFYDSFDYLFLRGRKRTIPSRIQQERTPKIVEALDKVSVPIGITNHGGKWAELLLRDDLLTAVKPHLDKYPVYEIPLNFRSSASIKRFLLDHGFDDRSADFLLTLTDVNEIRDALTQQFGNKQKIEEVEAGTRNYPVLKELARSRRDEVDTQLSKAQSGDLQAAIDLANTIREAEYKRVFLPVIRNT